MKELSLLSKKCLTNIPMLLDAIAVTTNELNGIFVPIYDDIKNTVKTELRKNGSRHYCFDENEMEQGSASYMEQDERNNVLPQLSIIYRLPFSCQYRNKTYAFHAGWKYSADAECNTIQFFLSDFSTNCNILDNTIQDTLLSQIPDIWAKGRINNEMDNDEIYMELKIDETFTEDKIYQCANDYKQYILLPFISYLKNKTF